MGTSTTPPSPRIDLGERCAQFFQYSAAHAWEALARLCAPDAVFAQNGRETDLDGLLTMVRALTSSGIEYSYGNVRRTIAEADRRVVEQHHVTMRRGDGVEANADVCVVLAFDAHGTIVRVDEYVDSAAFAPLLH
jgi:ketosteroid isomerase-like protein